MALLILFCSSALLKTNTYAAGGQLLIDRMNSEASGMLNVPYRTNTITYNYAATINKVTFGSCPDMACTWAIDDSARITVTGPGGTVVTRDFISDTQDKPASDITDMFVVGQNTVKIDLIDRFTPLRGLPKPLYLAQSTGSQPLPTPKPPVKSIPIAMKNTNHPFNLKSKDPVNTFTGSFIYSRKDLEIKGRGPSPIFSRIYDSSNNLPGPLGQGWTHNYAIQLVSPDSASGDLVLIGPDGRADRFVFSSGNYNAPAGIYLTLLKNTNNTYTVTLQNQTTWSFDETGRLLRITDRFGNQSALGYDTNGKLVNIGDPAGRGSLTIGYNAQEKIDNITDWTNRVVRYGYDSTGRLTTVTDREGKVSTYGYDGSTQRITTIKDALNNTVVTNTYDAQGRVASQKDAKGLTTGQQTTFVYNTNTDNTKTTIVTYPKTSFETTWNFAEEDTYDTQGRIIKRVSKPVANSANWITQEYTYDNNGNKSSFKDGRGNTTGFCYDIDYSGIIISGSRGNLTRVIAPAPATGGNVLVSLNKYDDKNNLIQSISPKGVTSGTSANCSTNFIHLSTQHTL
jgi:YD repeat-containing protein